MLPVRAQKRWHKCAQQATATHASTHRGPPAWQAGRTRWAHGVYNACDGQPTRLGIFYDTLADMLGLERPARIGWDEAETRFSAMRLSFLRESRRLSNARLVADSGIAPHFTDFRDGLAASLRAQSAD